MHRELGAMQLSRHLGVKRLQVALEREMTFWSQYQKPRYRYRVETLSSWNVRMDAELIDQ